MNRRDFIKRLGIGAATVGVASIAGCNSKQSTIEAEKGTMPLRLNQHSDDKVSVLGFGMMRLPMKKQDGHDVFDQEQINRMVSRALEYGVNYFDTSPVYSRGQSERVTGIALKTSGVPRSNYYIATKLSNFSPDTQSREASIEMYEKSFKELQVDYIDYMLLHSIGSSMDDFNRRFIDNGVLDFLISEREAGRIRNIGFSFHGLQEVFDAALAMHDTVHWDFVQIQMNYLDWNHAHEISEENVNANYLYDELDKREIPVVIMEPLLGGRLAKVNSYVHSMLKAREPEKSIASWAFRFCATYPRVLTALSGMTYMEHLDDNLRALCPFTPLTDDELTFLQEDVADEMMKFPTIPCTACQYCMPCPYGLDIPGIFAHYNKCINDGRLPEQGDPKYKELRRAFLIGYDRSVPRLRQADHCVECCVCMDHCPQQIEIPTRMHEIDDFVEQLKLNV